MIRHCSTEVGLIVHDCDRGARYGVVGSRDLGAGSGGGARGSCVLNGDALKDVELFLDVIERPCWVVCFK